MFSNCVLTDCINNQLLFYWTNEACNKTRWIVSIYFVFYFFYFCWVNHRCLINIFVKFISLNDIRNGRQLPYWMAVWHLDNFDSSLTLSHPFIIIWLSNIVSFTTKHVIFFRLLFERTLWCGFVHFIRHVIWVKFCVNRLGIKQFMYIRPSKNEWHSIRFDMICLTQSTLTPSLSLYEHCCCLQVLRIPRSSSMVLFAILVTNYNPAETNQSIRLSYNKLSNQYHPRKELMKMSPLSPDDLPSSQQAQATHNQQVQPTQLPVQSGSNQSTPSQSAQQPQHTRKHWFSLSPNGHSRLITHLLFNFRITLTKSIPADTAITSSATKPSD